MIGKLCLKLFAGALLVCCGGGALLPLIRTLPFGPPVHFNLPLLLFFMSAFALVVAGILVIGYAVQGFSARKFS
jgi:hypothetical protein